MENRNYYTVHGWMINELGLSGTDLVVYAVIYGFTQHGHHAYNGSLKYLQSFTAKGRSTVIRSLSKLTDSGLLIKSSDFKNNVTKNTYKAILPYDKTSTKMERGGCQNDTGTGTKMERGGRVKMEPYTYSNNNNSNIYQKKGNFSEVFPTIDAFYETVKKKLSRGNTSSDLKSADFKAYYIRAEDWSEDNPEVERSASGWATSVLSWIEKDIKKGDLVKKKTAKSLVANQYEELLQKEIT